MTLSDLNDPYYERNLLAVLMLSPDSLGKLSDEMVLSESDFIFEMDFQIYQGLSNYIKKFDGMELYGVDLPLLLESIREIYPTTEVMQSDLNQLWKMSEKANDVAGNPVTFYTNAVKEHSWRRRVKAIGLQIAENAETMSLDQSEILGRADEELDSFALSLKDRDPIFVPEVHREILEHYTRISSGDCEQKQSTGFESIDKVLGGGLLPGTLGVIAARPGGGKTTLGMNIAVNIAEDQENMKPAVYFSFEMTRQSLFEKLLCNFTHQSLKNIINSPSNDVVPVIHSHLQKIFSRKFQSFPGLLLSEKPVLYLDEIERELKRLKIRKLLPSVCVFDYVQLMENRKPEQSKAYDIAKITRGIRELAKKYGFCAILLTQMNRNIESGKFDDASEPSNSYLRDSGAIEQDADWVLFLLPSKDKFGYVRGFFTKNRFGQISTIGSQLWFEFSGATSTFLECRNPQFNASHGMNFGYSEGTGIIKSDDEDEPEEDY